MGRFTSPDPLMASAYVENPQSWNRYSYALNNPLRYIDPDGMKSKPVFGEYKDLTEDERRIFENSTAKVGDQTLSGQQLYDALKNGNDGQNRQLASFLNQTAILGSVTFENGRTALSYVNSVSEFRVDRVIANVDGALFDQLKDARDSKGKSRYVGPEDSSSNHGDFDRSFREKFGSKTSQQLSFNSKLKYGMADVDMDEECPSCGNVISLMKHGARVLSHRVGGGKTDAYDIYNRIVTQRKIQPSYRVQKEK